MSDKDIPTIISRKQALELGLKYYFTGKPCNRGHISTRYTSNGCCACKAEIRSINRHENILYFREWRKRNPHYVGRKDKDHINALARIRYKNNIHIERAKVYEWRKNNYDKALACGRESYARHKIKYLAYAKAKRMENIDEYRRIQNEKRIPKREIINLRQREWRKNNPEKIQIIDRNHKLKRKNVEGKHTLKEIDILFKKQKEKCVYCKRKIFFKPKNGQVKAHIDHIIPLSKGGTNWIKNIQICCDTCNMSKRDKHPIDWAQQNGMLL